MGLGVTAQAGSLALPWVLTNMRWIHTETLGAVGLIAGLIVLALSAGATVGLSLFEFSRLLAFEQALRDEARPPPAAPSAAPSAPNHVNWRPRSTQRAAPPDPSRESA